MIATAPARAISIRAAWPEDQSFVARTFVEQLVRGERAAAGESADLADIAIDPVRRDRANAIVDRVLDAPTTRVLVAIEHDRIVGWLAYAAIPRVRAVLFAYVRNRHRAQGVAHDLVAAAWPHRAGSWVHAGLRGGSTKSLLVRFHATAMSLDELL